MKVCTLVIFILYLVSSAFSQSQKELLENAYDDSSVTQLQEFFENWRKEKLPIIDSEYEKLGDVQKDVYDLFFEFYNPLDMSRMKLDEWEYTMYKGVKYVIISNKIKYEFTRSLNPDDIFEDHMRREYKNDSVKMLKYLNDSAFRKFYGEHLMLLADIQSWGEDSITNFRPKLRFSEAKPLFERKHYVYLLSEFLGGEYVPLGTDNIMQPAYAKGDSRKREDFLGNFIFVMISHWGDHWVILTSPEVSLILFDMNRENAVVYYSFPYHAGYSVFTKNGRKWIFVSDKLTIRW